MAKFDLFLMQDMPHREVVELARLAEASGCENLWLIDGQDVFPDPWTTAALCAVSTSRIRIGPGVTNPITRHPRVTANATLSLHALSDGRAILGLGSGDNAVRTLGRRPASVAEMRDAIDVCRTRFRSDGADIPIYVAAAGPRMTALACESADGIIVPSGASTPEDLRRALERVDVALQDCGRDRASLRVLYYLGFAVAPKRKDALDDARGGVARRVMNFVGPGRLCPPELVHLRAEMEQVAAGYDYADHLKSHVAHASSVSDELVEAVSIAGTPQQAFACFADLWRAAEGHNVTFFLRPDGKGKHRSFELFVADILPSLATAD